MRIGAVEVPERIAVVAELGNNHEGDIELARELVREAARCGAHAVKFQAIDPVELVRPSETQRLVQLERFRLSAAQFAELHDLARELGVGFLCTPFYLGVVDFLAGRVDAFKIASGDNDFVPLLEAVAATHRPVVISTGMSELATIRAAVEVVETRWRHDGRRGELALLHCVSAYPAERSEAALATIPALADDYDCPIGYSDHVLGIDAAVAAAALGARIIEKHFTLRHDLSDFRDHRLSADPSELRELVERVGAAEAGASPAELGIEDVDELIGEPRTGMLSAERAVADAARRSVVAAAELPPGHAIEPGDLAWLRPGDGLRPGAERKLTGRTLRVGVGRGDPIGAGDVE
jgi:N,N'-diacetyllegionaminate synthase